MSYIPDNRQNDIKSWMLEQKLWTEKELKRPGLSASDYKKHKLWLAHFEKRKSENFRPAERTKPQVKHLFEIL